MQHVIQSNMEEPKCNSGIRHQSQDVLLSQEKQ